MLRVVLFLLACALVSSAAPFPIVVNTWAFTNATANAYAALSSGKSSLDAVEIGCTTCEQMQCDGTVGFGGSPDEAGETTLDAMIMDGMTRNVGSVGCLRRVKAAISVARAVMEHTKHTLLVGELATDFAKQMGFKVESLETPASEQIYSKWKAAHCQPNFWMDVTPAANTSCGPYAPSGETTSTVQDRYNAYVTRENHDTIGMLAIDAQGHVSSGTSTNGASHKISGRVGDSPIVGAGSYASEFGAAAATGDGDAMMRLVPSYRAVMGLERGLSPQDAAEEAIREIMRFYPSFNGAVLVLNAEGEVGAASHGFRFPYSVARAEQPDVQVFTVDPLE